MKLISKRILIFGLIVILGVVVCFLGSKLIMQPYVQEREHEIIIKDDLDRNVTVSLPIKRVVSLASSISETICALGCEDVLVAVDKHSVFPPTLSDKLNVGSGSTPNVELIVAQQPDIVFAWYYCKVVDELEEHGIPVYLINPKSIQDILHEIEVVGSLLNAEEEAEELKDFIEGYVELVFQRTANLNQYQKPLVYFEFANPCKTGNKETFTHEVVTLAGGINIAAEEPVRYPLLSPEYIVSRNPDVIVKLCYTTYPDPTVEDELKEEICSRPGWDSISAVREGRVYVIHYSEVTINPRFVIGLLKFAKWIQPDLFEDIDVDSVSKLLLEKYYGLEDYS